MQNESAEQVEIFVYLSWNLKDTFLRFVKQWILNIWDAMLCWGAITVCLNYHVTEELLKLHDIFLEDGLEVVAFQTTNLNNTVVI